MPQNNQIDRIEDYHSGRMSPEESASFEQELTADPALKAESDFQSSIIDGIKEFRKTQLKARLDAVDLSPGWLEFVQQSALVKSFGGVAIATAVGSGVYFMADTTEPPEVVESEPLVEVVEEVEMPVPEALAAPMESKEEVADEVESDEEIVRKEAIVSEAEVKKPIAKAEESAEEETDPIIEESPAVKEETKEEKKAFAPTFTAPDAGEVSDSAVLGSTELDDVPAVAESKEEAKPIEVETKNSKNSKIKYKYYDGKLFLQGNFNKQPYEILEINNAKGRRIYLLHQKKYYEIKTTDRLTELPEVMDLKLIRELRLIKANK